MKFPKILPVSCCLLLSLHAQNIGKPKDSEPDPILEAIREFNRKRQTEPNEVVVVLDPPADPAPAEKPPVLVTGKPPQPNDQQPAPIEITSRDEPTPQPETETRPEPEPITPEPEETEEENGLLVRVESIRKGSGTLDPSQIKLAAPFAPKPLSNPPPHWTLSQTDEAPAITREVELSPGNLINLTIRPHILSPDTDGASSFTISEPGYHALHGYQQENTVSAILDRSILRLDEDAIQLGDAIDKLQQLLSSLPKDEMIETDLSDQP